MSDKLVSPASSARLASMRQELLAEYERQLGFPMALDFDYEELAPLLQIFLNNFGDPGMSTWFNLQTKDIEIEVLEFFAQLFRAPKDQWWGYVTSGGSESNLYALYAARQKYPKAKVYYSSAAHYSVPKYIHILGQKGEAVGAQANGEMDYDALSKKLTRRSSQPAIIVATIGTTMTEARDNVTEIKRRLAEANVSEYYIHADAALAGIPAALLEPRSAFDFKDGVDSLCISGHKFIGSPVPSGVLLTLKPHQERLAAKFNYTGTVDTTISGSRSGHTSLYIWYAIQRWGVAGFRRRAQQAQKLAIYSCDQLQRIGWRAWRNPQAMTVVLASPSPALITKWQLATWRGQSHIICMPGVTKRRIDTFVADLEKDGTRV